MGIPHDTCVPVGPYRSASVPLFNNSEVAVLRQRFSCHICHDSGGHIFLAGVSDQFCQLQDTRH